MVTGSRDFRANPLTKLGGLKQLRVGKDVSKKGKPEDILMDVNTLEDLIEGIKKIGGSDDIINFAQSLFHGAASFKATQPYIRRTQYDQSGRFRYLEKGKQTIMSGKSNIPKIMLNALINTLNNPIVEEVDEEEVERPDYTRIQEIQRRASNYVESFRVTRKKGIGGSFDEGTLQAYGKAPIENRAFNTIQAQQIIREAEEEESKFISKNLSGLSRRDWGIGKAVSQLVSPNPLASRYEQFYGFQNLRGIEERNARLRGEANVRRLEKQRELSGGIGKFSDTLQDIAYKEAMAELIAPKETRLRRLTEQFGTRKRAEKYVAEEAKREKKLEQEHNKQLAQNNKLLGGMLKMRSIVRGPFGSQIILGPYGTLAWNALKMAKHLFVDLPLKHADLAMQTRTSAESVGISPTVAKQFGIATRAFGGSDVTATQTLGGIAMTRQGALVGGGLGGLGEAALRYGLNISGSGEGGIATTNEILIRSAAIMQKMKDETKAAFAKTLGIDKATFQLLKKGPEETIIALEKSEYKNPYTESYYKELGQLSESKSRLLTEWDSAEAEFVRFATPALTAIVNWASDTLANYTEYFQDKNQEVENIRKAQERVAVIREGIQEAQSSLVIPDLSLGPEMSSMLPQINDLGGYVNKVYDESTKNWTYEIHIDGAKNPEETAREIERIIRDNQQEQFSDLAIGGVGR